MCFLGQGQMICLLCTMPLDIPCPLRFRGPGPRHALCIHGCALEDLWVFDIETSQKSILELQRWTEGLGSFHALHALPIGCSQDVNFFPMPKRLNAVRRRKLLFVRNSRAPHQLPKEAFRAAILLPWDLNLVMFHDLYAMAIPMFLPNKDGLHHTAFASLEAVGLSQGSSEKGALEAMKTASQSRGIFRDFRSPCSQGCLSTKGRDHWEMRGNAT